MNEEKNSLPGMPAIVMDRILGNLNFLNLISLRKVCRPLRTFVDNYSNLNSSLNRIRITVDSNSIKSIMEFSEDPNEITIFYERNSKQSMLVKFEKQGLEKSKILEALSHVDVFLADFEIFWKNQKSKSVEKLSLDFTGNPAKLSKGLRKILREHQNFQVKNFEIDASSSAQIFAILSEINPKNIQIWNKNDEKEYLELEEISSLVQWKNGEKLMITGFYVNLDIAKFAHFSRVDLLFEALELDQILEIKEMLLAHPHSEHFRIEFEHFKCEKALIKSWGRPFSPPGQVEKFGKKWFFRTSDPSEILEIRLHTGNKSIGFQRLSRNYVPNGGEIRD